MTQNTTTRNNNKTITSKAIVTNRRALRAISVQISRQSLTQKS
jgi:hypothetical protein